MQERRATARVRSFIGGRIVFNNRNSSVDCLLRNMSSNGAKISLLGAVTIPDEFELVIPVQSRNIRARVAWRRADEFGVQFIGTEAARTAASA
jgi:hypothetical protein